MITPSCLYFDSINATNKSCSELQLPVNFAYLNNEHTYTSCAMVRLLK